MLLFPTSPVGRLLLLCLRDFHCVKLYKTGIVLMIETHARAELRLTIRQEMENNRNCNEKQRIPFLIGEELVQIGNKKALEAIIKIKAIVNHARHSDLYKKW